MPADGPVVVDRAVPGTRAWALGSILWILCLAGCSQDSAAPTSSATAGADPAVRRGTFQSVVLLTGELKAIEAEPIVVPRTPTWRMPIRWLEADGEQVTVGQKVLELDNSEFAGDLEENRLEESRALNDLMQKEADIAVELADKKFAVARTRALLEKAKIEADVPEALISRYDHQEKKLEREKAKVALDKAVEDLQAAERASQAELEELRIALDKTRDEVATSERAIEDLVVRAPRAGILVVSENRREGRKFQNGDNVHVGQEVMQIPDLSAMKIEAQLSDVDDGKIEVGMRASCTLDTYPDRTYAGRVVDITPVAKEQGWQSMRRAFRAVVELEDSDAERMRPGMSVRVEVLADPLEQALIVPRTALDLVAEPPRVLLAGGKTSEVRLGPCNARECVVDEGVEEFARLGRRE